MRKVIGKFFADIGRIFSKRNLIWHGIAIALTYFLVVSGIDWWVVEHVGQSGVRDFARLGNAGFIGFYMPIALPLIALSIGWMRKNALMIKAGWLTAQAGITGLLLSFFYKALTGRPGPVHFDMVAAVADNSEVFQFGFLRGGVFWGWPSSHITVAVAGMVVLMVLYKHNALVKYLALAYAVYMALSVSITFHWFSDGVAGVIFGTVVGMVVAGSDILKGKHKAT